MQAELPTRATALAFMALAGFFLWGRGLWEGGGPPGTLVEVAGDLPRTGVFRLERPTLVAAVQAAGGSVEHLSDRPLTEGQRLIYANGTWEVREASSPLLFGQPIDLNAADVAALASIPGLGQAASLRIVTDRSAKGEFRPGHGVGRVKGVGDQALGRMIPYVSEVELVTPEVPYRMPASSPGGPKVVGGRSIDINRATARQLEGLPGIGPKIAERIVAWRLKFGPFRTVHDLTQVQGIGPKTVERIGDRAMVTQENG